MVISIPDPGPELPFQRAFPAPDITVAVLTTAASLTTTYMGRTTDSAGVEWRSRRARRRVRMASTHTRTMPGPRATSDACKTATATGRVVPITPDVPFQRAFPAPDGTQAVITCPARVVAILVTTITAGVEWRARRARRRVRKASSHPRTQPGPIATRYAPSTPVLRIYRGSRPFMCWTKEQFRKSIPHFARAILSLMPNGMSVFIISCVTTTLYGH